MTDDTATRASSVHVYPLTIRELLLTGVRRAPDQQIVYEDKRRSSQLIASSRNGSAGWRPRWPLLACAMMIRSL